MSAQQQNFFDTALYAIQGVKTIKKRVRYKTPTYIKKYQNDNVNGEIVNDDMSLWGEMKKIYIELANYFPLPFGSTETIFDFDCIRIWKQEYTNDSYVYKGKRYKEVPDLFFEAEIKGTENLPVEERLKIHQELLNLLKQGEKIENALQKVTNERIV